MESAMRRSWYLTMLTLLLMVTSARSAPWRFQWQKGQALVYRVEQTTKVAETAAGSKVETASKLNLAKHWEIQDVDAEGIATVRLVLSAMRYEQTRPNGEVLTFDSANPAKSTPELRESMFKYIGRTLALLRVDGQGKVVEVLEGEGAKYESDPPFILRLPPQDVQAGQSWKRAYHVTLDPPLGTGEKIAGTQLYQVQKLADNRATIHLSTELQMPKNAAEQPPLLQKLPEGDIVFDIRSGRLLGVRLQIDKTVQGHQGDGSSYRFSSVYSEELVGQ
jgi:hypothetical protein